MVFKVLLLLVLWFLSAASNLANNTECQRTCGNVDIPYPFGMGDSACFRNHWFNISCEKGDSNTSSMIPKLHLASWIQTQEAKNISLHQGQITVETHMFQQCSGDPSSYRGIWDYYRPSLNRFLSSRSPYTLSNSSNKFTAIGCDMAAYFSGFREDGSTIMNGCLSICSTDLTGGDVPFEDGECNGVGCCQVPISDGLKIFLHYTQTIGNDTENYEPRGHLGKCRYTGIVDQRQFKFYTSDLDGTNFLKRSQDMQTVFDWVAGIETCKEAQQNKTDYACRSDNSYCYESTNGRGYRCNCSEGYGGNPYVDGGCKDVNECDEEGKNPCVGTAKCTNTIGRYTCTCPKGTHGDGENGGKGCIEDTQEFPILKVFLGIGLSLLFLLIGSSWTHWLWRKRKMMKLKEKFFQQNGGIVLQEKISSRRGDKFKIFTTEELEKATDQYSSSNIVGQGGYGIVYKGVVPDNKIVAIKKSKMVDANQIEQFINELDILSQINHRNVVKLLGCCLEAEVPILVYEFISNGTLSNHIHNVTDMPSISLENRLRIAEETADALAYLHSTASMPIFHRDVKSTNILLDENFTAKVSDFGASRLVLIDQTQITTLVQGTLGYLDPEYFQTGQLTAKSDVYSFGVVLVELLTGEKPVCFNRNEEERNLAMYFILAMKDNRLFQVLDDRVLNEGKEEQLMAIGRLAKRCLRLKGEERPTMREVVVELQGLRRFQEHPWVNNYAEETEGLLVNNSNIELAIQ